ncbi:MAG: DUF4296 domain-containing protein [Marinifilaceae bacterium]|nr:DUF4296 domain-containing protein [Marinifilaceae bacterium]
MKRFGYILLLFLSLLGACQSNAPMDRETFTRLLVEIHLTDAVIDQGKRHGSGFTDKKNYSYYGGIFNRYGIDRATFDSCISYYSRQTQLFDEIYVDVVDSLNKRLTTVKRIMAKLQINDTVNILTLPDTLFIDGWSKDTLIVVKNLKSGKYLFEMGVKLDSFNTKGLNKIESYFIRNYSKDTLYYLDSIWHKPHFIRIDSVLGQDGQAIKVDSIFTYEEREDRFIVSEKRLRVDTFKMRNINLSKDTAFHKYNFSTYIDSTFGELHLRFIVSSNRDTVVPYYGYSTDIALFNKYISPTAEKEQQRDFRRKITNGATLGDTIFLLERKVALMPQKDSVQ